MKVAQDDVRMLRYLHPLYVANNTTGTATQTIPGRFIHGFLTFHNLSNPTSIFPSHSLPFFVLLLPTLSFISAYEYIK
jgi:hypothetical protein